MKIHILAIGRLRGAHADLCAEYAKRITPRVIIKELTAPTPEAEGRALFAAVPPKAFVAVLDEHGKDLSSRELAVKLAAWQDQGVGDLAFVIGGADGVSEAVKNGAGVTLGLGRKTWPHKLVRVMLLEQLYRAQQINSGHPYHRD
ncbi:MAG: 23S rRNA (pseudouridine(1915)-N(3))-methyltransferase RlmH [Alphaproteobacteria bacterium]|nr:23S rRNA (pseudouridine(1915)-N(3))-methyltransferase RlmH [Alphaproteobacteria bacterium]